MHRTTGIGALLTLIIVCSPTFAGNLWSVLIPAPVPDCVGTWVGDDYCAKKQPCVGASLGFGCDDYCAKKEPCVRAPLRFGYNDYCAKRLPQVCFRGGGNLNCRRLQARASCYAMRVISKTEPTKSLERPLQNVQFWRHSQEKRK